MPLPSALQLHYRCTFELEPATGTSPSWTDIVKSIRAWISEKLMTNEAYGSRWFFVGGEWKPPGQPRVLVKTKRAGEAESEEVPHYWSIRYEHPCSEVSFRQWRTDIAITSLGDDHFRLSLANMHWLLPEFIGEEPSVPLPSAPKIVGYTVSSRKWIAFAGSEQLRSRPVLLNVGSGNDLAERVRDVERTCPLILVTREFTTDKYLVDPQRLARLLAGTATVYEATSKEVNNELEWFLPRSFRCWDGMVRIYQPQVDLESEYDSHRHRFFTKTLIQETGPQAVEDMIVRGITRSSRTHVSDVVTSLEDIVARRREARLSELRAAADDKSRAEWIELLESENKDQATRIKGLESNNTRFKDDLESTEAAHDEVVDKLATTRFELERER